MTFNPYSAYGGSDTSDYYFASQKINLSIYEQLPLNASNTSYTSMYTPEPEDLYDPRTYTSIGVFIYISSDVMGFRPMYEVELTDEYKYRVKPIGYTETLKVDITNICSNFDTIEYGRIYKIVYKLPINQNKCTLSSCILKIMNMTKLLIYNYDGIIRRYSMYKKDLYFVELSNNHHIQILNPDKLMPIRVTKPTNQGSDGASLVTAVNNYTYYEKVIIQGSSFDDAVDCDNRYMHMNSISYYDKR
jgi:hypothetical protein